jgi:hypothetical protein
MPKPNPKLPEHFRLKLLGFEVSALGRYPINCAVVLCLLWMVIAVVWLVVRTG